MTSRAARLLALGALAAACGVRPPPHDGGVLTVPAGYHVARAAPGHRQHLALTGEKQTACRDCHALETEGFRPPGPQLCERCHEAQARQHHPLDAGVDLTCLTCHPFAAAAGDPRRFERWSCLGCHASAQGGKRPITVHAARCEACHRPHEQPFTQSADCTTCHAVSLQHGAKGDTLAEACMACHAHHAPAAQASAGCVGCHQKPALPARARVAPGALFAPGHAGCGTCHPPHAFVKGAVRRCATCHEGHPVLGASKHDGCVGCHRPHQPRAAPVPCVTCHGAEEVKHPQDAKAGACLGCHPVHPRGADGALARPCTACHVQPAFTAAVVHAKDMACVDCHVPHEGKPVRQAACGDCHEAKVAAVQRNAGHARCDGCHAGLPHGVASEKVSCLACHPRQAPPQAGHREAGCGACHESHSGEVVKTCAQCHDGKKPLPGLHAVAAHQACETCHGPHAPSPVAGPRTCQGCHQRLPTKAHTPLPAQCSGCHLFRDAAPGGG